MSCLSARPALLLPCHKSLTRGQSFYHILLEPCLRLDGHRTLLPVLCGYLTLLTFLGFPILQHSNTAKEEPLRENTWQALPHASVIFETVLVNWERPLLPLKTPSTPQRNADISRVLPCQTGAVILTNRRKNRIWIAQKKNTMRLKSHQDRWSITGSVFKVRPAVQGFKLQDFLACDFSSVTEKVWDIIKPSLRDGTQPCLNCKAAFSSKFSPKCLVKQALICSE